MMKLKTTTKFESICRVSYRLPTIYIVVHLYKNSIYTYYLTNGYFLIQQSSCILTITGWTSLVKQELLIIP